MKCNNKDIELYIKGKQDGRKELQERIDKTQEGIIKLRDEIIDNIHNVKEITKDYLYLEKISCSGLKEIFEILCDGE